MHRKFLVIRQDGIKRNGTAQLQSSCFPIEVVVDYYDASEAYAERIVRMACDQINEGYRPGAYNYVVVPLDGAIIVSFRKPQPKYEVSTAPYV